MTDKKREIAWIVKTMPTCGEVRCAGTPGGSVHEMPHGEPYFERHGPEGRRAFCLVCVAERLMAMEEQLQEFNKIAERRRKAMREME